MGEDNSTEDLILRLRNELHHSTYPAERNDIRNRYMDTAYFLYKSTQGSLRKSFLNFGSRRSSIVSSYGNTPTVIRRSFSSEGKLDCTVEQLGVDRWRSARTLPSVGNEDSDIEEEDENTLGNENSISVNSDSKPKNDECEITVVNGTDSCRISPQTTVSDIKLTKSEASNINTFTKIPSISEASQKDLMNSSVESLPYDTEGYLINGDFSTMFNVKPVRDSKLIKNKENANDSIPTLPHIVENSSSTSQNQCLIHSLSSGVHKSSSSIKESSSKIVSKDLFLYENEDKLANLSDCSNSEKNHISPKSTAKSLIQPVSLTSTNGHGDRHSSFNIAKDNSFETVHQPSELKVSPRTLSHSLPPLIPSECNVKEDHVIRVAVTSLPQVPQVNNRKSNEQLDRSNGLFQHNGGIHNLALDSEVNKSFIVVHPSGESNSLGLAPISRVSQKVKRNSYHSISPTPSSSSQNKVKNRPHSIVNPTDNIHSIQILNNIVQEDVTTSPSPRSLDESGVRLLKFTKSTEDARTNYMVSKSNINTISFDKMIVSERDLNNHNGLSSTDSSRLCIVM